MQDRVPEYVECDQCGAIVPDGGHVHEAHKKVFNASFGNYIAESKWLCCMCYRYVGGTCDER